MGSPPCKAKILKSISIQSYPSYTIRRVHLHQLGRIKSFTTLLHHSPFLAMAAAASRAALLPYSSSSSSICCSSKPVPSTSQQQHHQQQPICTTQLSAKPKSRSPLHSHPLYTPTQKNVSPRIREMILCLEIMGVDSGKAMSQNPTLHSASLASIHSIICFLQSKGIQEKDLPRIIGMCPSVLTSDIKTELNPVFGFLAKDLKVPENQFRKVVNKCPRLLVSSVKDQLKPCLFYLQRLGFKDLTALAFQDPILLVSNVEKTLIPKLRYLESVGFSKDVAMGMVLRCPSLFTFSVENNFRPKLDYYLEEMKGKLEDLKEFPQYFTFSLEKRIQPRHREAAERCVDLPLSTMLKATDDEFRELIAQAPLS